MTSKEQERNVRPDWRLKLAHWLRFGGQKAAFEKSGLFLVVAMLIGIATACLAHFMVAGVEFLSDFCFSGSQAIEEEGNPWGKPLFIFLLTYLGIMIASWIRRIFSAPKSLTSLIYGLNRYRSSVPNHEIWSHVLSSIFSVGFGGSAGLEAPGVLTGTAIASTCSDLFCIRGRSKTILVGCGAAAAISAIFRSPVAGVLFTVEALLPSLPVSVLVALTISSASAYFFMTEYFGNTSLYYLARIVPFESNILWTIILCAFVCAYVGALFIRLTAKIGGIMKKVTQKNAFFSRLAVLLLCGLLLAFPHLRGQGHSFVEALLYADAEDVVADMEKWSSLLSPALLLGITLATAILLKPLASVMSIELGDGGIFAPTLFIGAVTGFIFARLVNLSGWAVLPEGNFAALGMCGVFAAVMRSPLTAIFLVIETTHGFSLTVPLMFVSSIAWFIGHYMEPNSIYRRPLARASLVSDDRVRSTLMNIPVPMCMKPVDGQDDESLPTIREDAGGAAALELMEKNGCDELIVVNEKGQKLGRVAKRDILEKYLASTVNR